MQGRSRLRETHFHGLSTSPRATMNEGVKRLRLDLHVHSRFSSDALSTPEELWHMCKTAGLDGFAITDHDRAGGYARLVQLGLADPNGKSVDGVLVIPGVEVSCVEGHVLVLGAGWDAAPGTSAAQVVRRAHSLGALAIAAHPMERSRWGVGRSVLETVGFDGVEAHNSKTLERGANVLAERFAAERGLPMTAGSDSHFATTLGRAHTIVEAAETSVEAALAGIKLGRTELVRGFHTHAEIARYVARGWLTRPWLIELAKRKAQVRRMRRIASRAVSLTPQGLPGGAFEVFEGVEVVGA